MSQWLQRKLAQRSVQQSRVVIPLFGNIPMPFTPEDALANVGACHQFYTVALRD
jgi:hypothetical protein